MRAWNSNASRRFARVLLASVTFIAGIWLIPHRWCAREAASWYEGNAIFQEQLARGVEYWITNEIGQSQFSTRSDLFNGEWLFGTYFMAGMAFGQLGLEHPEQRVTQALRMEKCLEQLMSKRVRAFDHESWKEDPLESLDGSNGHAAYLGYANLLLSFHRLIDPASRFAELNDRVTGSLTRRLESSPLLLLETYPGEVYPVDNCAVMASIALHARARGQPPPLLLSRWIAQVRERYLDPQTGLLIQAVNLQTGAPFDAPRGSGTCLGQYFLSFADEKLAGDLYQAAKLHLAGRLFGFGMVREYPRSIPLGRGDIDSGPIILGYGLSATGFSLAGSRQQRDADTFARLFSTAYLFGAPTVAEGRRHFATGGPLGDAIMLAMLTAQPKLPAPNKL